MELSLILQGAFTGACAGLSCGSTCGSGMGVFLSGYLTSHAKGTKDSLRGFLIFYLGKILAVAGVCLGSSLLSRAVLDEASLLSGGLSLPLAADALMVGMGIFLVMQWFFEKKHHPFSYDSSLRDGLLYRDEIPQRDRSLRGVSIPEKKQDSASCSGCSHHSSRQANPACARHRQALAEVMEKKEKSRIRPLTLFGAGAGYGFTPCAPLILMAGYAASLSPANALLSGSVFAASSALSPLLILALLSGVLSERLKKEVPQCIDWFRLGAYVILIAIFTVDMVKLM